MRRIIVKTKRSPTEALCEGGRLRKKNIIIVTVRRPIIWGLIFFVIGAIGWVISVVLAVVTLGAVKILANIFGYIFALSLPAAIVWEIVLKIRKK